MPRNWRMESVRKRSNSTKVGWTFYAAWSGITNSESVKRLGQKLARTIGIHQRRGGVPWSWFIEQFQQVPRSASTSCRLEFQKEAVPRIYTRRYEYSWRRFWLPTCPTKSWRITQWFKEFGNILEKKDLEKVRAENHCKQYIYLAFRREETNQSRQRKLSYVCDR